MLQPIDFHQLAHALSNMIDQVGVDDLYHGKRVAYMCVETGRALGLPEKTLQTLYYAALLHDCGVSSTDVHTYLVNEMDWSNSQVHCRRGYVLLKNQVLFAPLAEILLYHHTHWAALQALELPSDTVLLSNLIYLADRVDAHIVQGRFDPPLLGRSAVHEMLCAAQGEYFAPHLVQAFLEVSQPPAFWLGFQPGHIQQYITEFPHPALLPGVPAETKCNDCLKEVAGLFADIVDAKSQYTAEHSHGVAGLSRHLAGLAGLQVDVCEMVEIAGLLHDLGKLKVPDAILTSSQPLSQREQAIMTAHAFDTYQILRGIHGFELISEWAGHHHEALDGSGYPFGLHGEQLSLPERIIAVADVFQALAQHRPYKPPVEVGEVLAGLQTRAAEGKIDASVVELIANDLDVCWESACGRNRELDITTNAKPRD